jgi:hypothetical protein
MDYADQMWTTEQTVEERARLARYGAAWAAYFGDMPDPLKVKPGQADDNVKVNYARLIVDVGASDLFGEEPQFDLDPDSTEPSPAQIWLDECWRRNRKQILLQKLAINGGVCGHCFLKIVPRVGDVPRLINISPEYVSVVTDPDDIDQVWRYIIQYTARDPQTGKPITIRQVIERDEGGRWSVVDQVSRNRGSWETRQTIAWPYTWPPVVDCQNLPSPNEYFGIADIEEDVLALNAAYNFTKSNTQRIIRFHAHPKTWGRGFTAKELNIGVDDTIILQSPTAELHNLEMQGDLSSSIEYAERLKRDLHETSRVPEVATGKLDSAAGLSGVALQILYQPLTQKTRAKRLTYGEMLIELCRRVLEVGGFGSAGLCSIVWGELRPHSTLEERQTLLLDKQLGASQDTLLAKAGYDPDAEKEKRDQEQTGVDLADQLLGAFDRGQGA